jgi:molybdopterin biosynthesis enzyme
MRQIVTRLTPVADVRATIEGEVQPAAPRACAVADAAGCVLAEDVAAPPKPARAIAVRDGWALRADETQGASAYAPALLSAAPLQIETGQPIPDGCDCVAPFDDVHVAGDAAEVVASFAPGDGVLAAGGDHDGRTPVLQAGARLSATACAALAALGLANVQVRRPRLRIAPVRNDPILSAAAEFIIRDVQTCGCDVDAAGADAALAATDADLVVLIGGTGSGDKDASVSALARGGRVAVHGIALSPGETSGFGFVGSRPVLLLPGRLDGAVAAWLMLGRVLVNRLSAARARSDVPQSLTLARKISSTVGVMEVVLVRCVGAQAEPLAAGAWALSAVARADGYVVIAPESEGSSAGSAVQVWPLI